MKIYKIITTIISVFAISGSMAIAQNEHKPYHYDLDVNFLKKTNRQIEKEMSTLEKQVELLVKMISNEKYRDKIQTEFSEVLVTYVQSKSSNYDPKKCGDNCKFLGTAKNEAEWKRGQKLSFLASVLKKYKAPLSKTCIGDLLSQPFPRLYQPLNWNFPIAFLSGQMFAGPSKKSYQQELGFGMVDLLPLGETELIRMANISNKIIELQTVLRDGIEGKLNEDILQQYVSFEHATKLYRGKYNTPFGTGDNRLIDKDPCDIFKGKGKAEFFWPVIGYEIILPKEIITGNTYFNWRSNDYIFGGGILESDLEKFPPEYINAWKNLAIFFNDYFPELNAEFPINMYDELLSAKAEEPLGDLMSDENEGSNSTIEDDELALPSLE